MPVPYNLCQLLIAWTPDEQFYDPVCQIFRHYFSNIFAIIGLRSLFFLIQNIVEKFRFLKIGLSVLLIFIGVKMLIHGYYQIPTMQSLLIVLGILTLSILLSIIFFPEPL